MGVHFSTMPLLSFTDDAHICGIILFVKYKKRLLKYDTIYIYVL